MTDGIEQQGADQQVAAVHGVGEEGKQRRLDAEQGTAVGDQCADSRRIDGKGLAQIIDQASRREDAGANDEVTGQECPEGLFMRVRSGQEQARAKRWFLARPLKNCRRVSRASIVDNRASLCLLQQLSRADFSA